MIAKLLDKWRGNELDRILARATRRGEQRFLVFWNRGLGDIALGLCALFAHIRAAVSGAHITVLTRSELEEAFRLVDVNRVVVAPSLARQGKLGFAEACAEAGLDSKDFDVVLEHPNPTKWLVGQIGQFTPRLRWEDDFDPLARRFDALLGEGPVVAAHVNSETGQYYGYVKDWPITHWRSLFVQCDAMLQPRIVLFGNASDGHFASSTILDLRGQTSLLEMLSIIKNRCAVLVAPDSGVLTMAYYLDRAFPLTVISLWADPRQGILKQAVPSPNPLLRHVPLRGDREDVTRIPVEKVFEAVNAALALDESARHAF
jgi:ADP-heptose:LPS heptosyltransferase